MGHNKANPAFICLRHEGGTNPGLFLKKINGEWWAVHYEKGHCRTHPAPGTDERRAQTADRILGSRGAGRRLACRA